MSLQPAGSRLRALLDSGKSPLVGAFSALLDPAAVEMIAMAGYDFAGIEMEHGSAGLDLLQNQVRAAAVYGMGTLVKLPASNSHLLLRVLECGVDALMLANIGGAAGARNAVEGCRYPPQGTRGASTVVRAAGYGSRRFDTEVLAERNRNLVVGVIVEEPQAVAEIDEILRVDGIDYVLIGVADLSVAMGLAGKAGDRTLKAAVDRVIAACNSVGMPMAFPLEHPAYSLTAIQMAAVPMRIIVAGSDTSLLYRGLVSALERARPG
jgi:2-keto-3-deoxy-L-rhamnonate aldolase RhmA